MKTWLLLCFLLVSSAFGQRLELAQELYKEGEFLRASQVARQLETSEGFALAARALYEYAMLQAQSKREPLMLQCKQFAQRSLELNPKNANAYFELGAGAGQLALIRGTVWAFLNGLPQQIRGYFEKAIVLEPRHTFAMVALVRWHAEVVVGGGGFLYNASAEEALKLLERAVQIEPKSISIRVNFAETLMVLDKQKNRAAAKAQLEIALTLHPKDFLERKALEHAKKGLEQLR
ncbi:MAG: tetratricopeptide repeat protein [Deinococcales bacterium]